MPLGPSVGWLGLVGPGGLGAEVIGELGLPDPVPVYIIRLEG